MSLSPFLKPDDIYELEKPLPSWRWRGRVIGNNTPAARTVNWDALLVEAVTLPNGAAIPARPIFLNGINRYYPDFTDVQALTVSFYETQRGTANLNLQAWRKLIVNRSGNDAFYGYPSEFKQEMSVDMYGYESNDEAAMSYQVTGVWPTEPGSWNLTYDTSNRLILQVTLQCDNVEYANRQASPANLQASR